MQQERAHLTRGELGKPVPRDVLGGGEAYGHAGARGPLEHRVHDDDRFLPIGVVLGDTAARRRHVGRSTNRLDPAYHDHVGLVHPLGERRVRHLTLQLAEGIAARRERLLRRHRVMGHLPDRDAAAEHPPRRIERRSLPARVRAVERLDRHGIARGEPEGGRLVEHTLHANYQRPRRRRHRSKRGGADLGHRPDKYDIGPPRRRHRGLLGAGGVARDQGGQQEASESVHGSTGTLK
jgi:hypothetical protein